MVNLRFKLAQLLGVPDPSRLILTVNSTDALNLALKGLLKENDHVIITDLEHNAVLRPLWGLRRTRKIAVTTIPSNTRGEVNPDDIFRAVTPLTRLIVCTHASNVLGTIQPIGEITRRSRELGIPTLVDGSQTAGAIPVHLDKLGVDLFAFTGHKSLLGPTGTGGLAVSAGLELEPFREGGNGSHSEDLEQPKSWPERHESGTPNTFGLVGLLAGVEYLQEKSVVAIRNHELELTRHLMEKLSAIEELKIHGPEPESKVGITSVSLKVLDTSEVGQILGKKFGIMVRTGIHCAPLIHKNLGTQGQGTIRFSVGWSNTHDDVEKAANAMQEIAAAIYRRRA
jgi:cysteine desulfurase family protein